MQDVFPQADQFNSIHERLIEAWKCIAHAFEGHPLVFSAISGNIEDFMTVSYLRDTAMQAGLETSFIEVERIGWNHPLGLFVDEQEQHIKNCFKLYPWEWMIRERFATQLLEARDATRWLEPPWKMILSNKAILPVLYDLFPDSPYLLPASLEPMEGPHVRKPLLGREGSNVSVVGEGGIVQAETGGDYEGPYVYQRLHPLPSFGGRRPVVGSWMVNGYACGIGVREDATPITGNASRFVPHVFTE